MYRTLFVDFIEKYLQMLEDNDIMLPEESHLESMFFGHFRYFNYDWFLSLCQVLVSTERFEVLRDIVQSDYCVIRKTLINSTQSESFLCLQAHNYTLNDYKNRYQKLNRISVKADYLYKRATKLKGDDIVKTDLLLYNLSLIYPHPSDYRQIWFPDCSVYNRGVEMLPKLVSKRYFEKAKVLFSVNNVDEYKQLITSLKSSNDYYDGNHMIPNVIHGLSFASVATI